MQVILIGAGNVAALLGKLLVNNGHKILQVYSRTEAHAKQLAISLNAVPVNKLDQVHTMADLYILAVSDQALPEVVTGLILKDKLVIHTAGSVSKEVLKNTTSNYGVLWPIKMIRSTTVAISPATIVIDASTPMVEQKIKEIALLFSTSIVQANDLKRAKMHMMAVLTTNFSNHLYQLADEYCEKESIAFSDFYPLIEAAAQEIKNHHPRNLQAGPAFRSDRQTIEKHEQLLAAYPQMREVYRVITTSIMKSFKV